MAAARQVQVMLGRRPGAAKVKAFGHVDVSKTGRSDLQDIVRDILGNLKPLQEVPFHPDDMADEGEVLTASLQGFDSWFQANAAWSLERAVKEIRSTALPSTLNAQGISQGDWSFYVVRAVAAKADIVVVRAKSPSYGLSTHAKLITMLVGSELQPVEEPLIAFDHSADLVVINSKIYVLNPRVVERLLVDAAAVKARAASIASSFQGKLGAGLSAKTVVAVERVCSANANIGRRVERLTRDGSLQHVTVKGVRQALPDAGLSPGDFGTGKVLQAVSDVHAKVLIDIAADLYYQPRFEARPRRVASYRRL